MGTRERKEREKEARKDAIIEAAKKVFFDKGFAAATMDQIAEEAELSKGSLYNHFSSKEDLYVSLLLEGLDILNERFRKASAGAVAWEGKLRAIGEAYYRFYRDAEEYFHVLFFLQHGEIAAKVSDSLYQTCFERGVAVLGILSDAIREGMVSGEIKRRDPMELAVLMWGFMNGVFFLYREEEHRKLIPGTLDELIRSSIDLMIGGLKKG